MPNKSRLALVSVMLCFFSMGFVDLVGIASNYVKADLHLSDTMANTLPSLVFFWFLIFSIPTSMLMNRIGRKKTVMLSLFVTVLSLILPLCGQDLILMLISFSLLGIGNALMQTSLNPLVASVIGQQNLASTLTFGQFIKAIASFLAPYLATWGAAEILPTFGLGWRVLFPIYTVIGIIASIALLSTHIVEDEERGSAIDIVNTLKLLKNPAILLSFIGIMCHVGLDVGVNTTAPKILTERLHLSLNDASFSTSLYFIFRTIGCLSGSIILRYISSYRFFMLSVVMMALSMVGFCLGSEKLWLYIAIALIGFGNSNVFSMIFARALNLVPTQQNEVSGLMIMGLFGGTIFPLFMGLASDSAGQVGAVGVMSVGVLYLLFYLPQLKTK